MNTNTLPKHPCQGKCTEFKEEQCSNCLILVPQCDYCGSDSMVSRTENNDGFICADCYWEDKPEHTVALFGSDEGVMVKSLYLVTPIQAPYKELRSHA